MFLSIELAQSNRDFGILITKKLFVLEGRKFSDRDRKILHFAWYGSLKMGKKTWHPEEASGKILKTAAQNLIIFSKH